MNMQSPRTVACLAATLLLVPFAWTGCAANGQNTPTPPWKTKMTP